jgi:hypothetical protein
MQVNGTTYGIIPDTFNTILNNYLTPLLNVFPNATSMDDPIYALAYQCAVQDQLNQAALQTLWNAINANTAQGLGLDILANTVLNLQRNGLIQSSCGIAVTIGPIYSTCQIQLTVTSGAGTIPIGWTVTGTASPTSPYQYVGPALINPSPGVYYLEMQSLDTSTPIPASSFNTGTPVGSLVFTVTNPAAAVLGSLTLPKGWGVSALLLNPNGPVYSLNSPETFTSAGTYNMIVYSDNITQPVSPMMLTNIIDNLNGLVTKVSNKYSAILGTPPETNAQFQARRKYYLNVQGQTYYGMEKAIINLKTPALESVFIAETITSNDNLSVCLIQIVVNYTGSPVILPVGWTVFGTATPEFPYQTIQEYTFNSSGTYYILVYSKDVSTSIPIGNFTSAQAPYPGNVTSIANTDPAVLGQMIGLGQRGYTVYLAYPVVYSFSFCVMQLVVTSVVGGPITIPIGWQATGFVTTSPYVTQQTYTISSAGTYFINVFSSDLTTNVPIGGFTGGNAVAGLTFTASNTTPSTLGGGFDTNDLYLQQIAQACYAYHPLGTQFYPAVVGSTVFTVPTPYTGYTYDVTLNPFQTVQVTCNLLLVFNTDPNSAGYNGGVFDTTLLPTLQTSIQEIINNYFLSKTLPTDLVYTINELSEILQNTYAGIVALVGNGSTIFSFGTLTPSVTTGRVYLQKLIGSNFQLSTANFNFNYINKDLFP